MNKSISQTLAGEVPEAEWKARLELAACYRLVAEFGWSDLAATHISVRVPGPEHHFLINPYGVLFDEITASSLVKVDLDGQVVGSRSSINPAGFIIHGAIHMARPELSCVLHTHTPAGAAVATQRDGLLPITQQALVIFDDVAYHDYEGAALNLGERERILEDLGEKRILILRNHGLLTVGRTVGEAFVTMYRIERACRYQLAFQAAGVPAYPLTEEVRLRTVEQGRKIYGQGGFAQPGAEWESLLARLDRRDPSYRQ
ncbi:class II aldolase/adducin family protein [Siccirubricoccus phaeus]|uniref:class II aldolase/adducin family protein n=1 Tax=Siccirubricoccus phaeus TaxID=2595053 RepID=UPI0011F2365C|nr:class II aldolase/adducin family protein [Siccirubricoccus phaeus]